ncbi:hypothetical protein AX774_g1618 [Zancudomyces culisetae]|uniref:Uncharacterized protein n=1 Tax=Zancudomyces culisetae TaxID=1213189 RepID=A0A1R1PV82_ZANCU|nr:hypothetical protein AX774_g1618 [Zancudomyces culisetae]|eukprot:OMH84839.1 hypothetical protein AX774_g1618 [Zancudomyces culisetae]
MVRRVISDAEVQKHSQSSKLKMFENDTVLDLIRRIKSHVRYSSNLVQRTLERIEEFDEVSCTSSWNLRNLSCASSSENTHVEHDLILHNDHLLNNCIISTARRVVRTEHPLNLEHVLKFRAQIKRFIESETPSDNQPVYKNDAYKVDAKKNRRGFSAVCAGGLVLLPPTAKNNQSFTFIRQPHTREELRKLVISQNEFGNTVLWDDRFFLRLEVNDPTGYDGWTVTPLELAATSEMFVPLNSQQIAEHNLDKHRDHLLCIGVQHFAVSLKTFARNSPVFLKTNKKRYLRDLPVISVGAYNEPGRTLNLCVAIPALNLFFLDSNFVFYQSLK